MQVILLRIDFFGFIRAWTLPSTFAELGEDTLVIHVAFFQNQGPAAAKRVIIW